jgi:hypothetical protein
VSNCRLEFIKAKYFDRNLGVPELSPYTDVESPLDTSIEGPFPFEVTGADDEKEDVFKKFSNIALNSPIPVKKKKVAARRVTVSDSESDGDITEVLKEVVRDYTATHARSTRPAERVVETQTGSGMGKRGEGGKDLISFD